MKYLLEVCLIALMLTGSTSSSAVTSDPPMEANNAAFASTWTGNGNGLPAIKLTIQGEESPIRGDIIFYLQIREDASHPWHLAGAATGPLLSPHVEGKTLTFAVQHHRCDGCAELGADVKFRMALAGPNEAQLWKLGEGPDSGPGMILVRQTEGIGSSAPPLQQAISVQLPVTRNAIPLPDADQPESLIVTVTADGASYFGIDPITPAGLIEKLKTAQVVHARKLYLHADARSSYRDVLNILDAMDAVGTRESALLTSQPQAAKPGSLVAPQGLEVMLRRERPAGAVLVQLLHSGQETLALKINGENIPWNSLESKLGALLNVDGRKVVVLKADGQLSFASVVDVADRCQALGGKVVLITRFDT